MTADIIKFGSYKPPTLRPRPVVCEPDDTPRKVCEADDTPCETTGTLTTTAKNARMRSARHKAWRRADALTGYWHAVLDFELAASIAKKHGLKEARAQIETGPVARSSFLASYRDALGNQLLTPSPSVASVNWKRRKMSKAYYMKKELIEKAIADDIAFLNAHPTRQVRKGEDRS